MNPARKFDIDPAEDAVQPVVVETHDTPDSVEPAEAPAEVEYVEIKNVSDADIKVGVAAGRESIAAGATVSVSPAFAEQAECLASVERV